MNLVPSPTLRAERLLAAQIALPRTGWKPEDIERVREYPESELDEESELALSLSDALAEIKLLQEEQTKGFLAASLLSLQRTQTLREAAQACLDYAKNQQDNVRSYEDMNATGSAKEANLCRLVAEILAKTIRALETP